jgi:hypothetical protein
MKGVIVLHPLNKYFIQLGHNEKRYERCHRPLLISTSLYEVFVEEMEFDDTFHTFSHCDLTVWSIYWGDGVRWHLSYLFSLWPNCMKYLLRGWSTMTPFIHFLIVTSLTEVFIEGMEYDDTLHTFFSLWPHCMKYVQGHNEKKVWKVSSYSIPSINTSVSEVTIRKGVKGVIILYPLNKYFIQWGHNDHRYERCHRTPSPQ